ncbi:MAG: hypothetical protein ACPG1Z_03245 [Planctomycetota bacterium]
MPLAECHWLDVLGPSPSSGYGDQGKDDVSGTVGPTVQDRK